MARKTKLSDDTIKKLTDAISLGATYEMSCKYAGISYQTFRNWIIAGETSQKGMAFDLCQKVAEAEGKAVVRWLAQIETAAKDGQWPAAAWKLERRYPNDYGRQRVEVTGADGGEIVIAIVKREHYDAI